MTNPNMLQVKESEIKKAIKLQKQIVEMFEQDEANLEIRENAKRSILILKGFMTNNPYLE